VNDFSQAQADFIAALDSNDHLFASTLAFIGQWFDFTPSAFNNGGVQNSAEQNQGSCKVFALAQLLQLSKEQALLVNITVTCWPRRMSIITITCAVYCATV